MLKCSLDKLWAWEEDQRADDLWSFEAKHLKDHLGVDGSCMHGLCVTNACNV